MKMGGHPGKRRGGKRSDERVKTSAVEDIGNENDPTEGLDWWKVVQEKGGQQVKRRDGKRSKHTDWRDRSASKRE